MAQLLRCRRVPTLLHHAVGEVRRRWGTAMSDAALAACRGDIRSADRDQLADDVADLLDEVGMLRFVVSALADAAAMTVDRAATEIASR